LLPERHISEPNDHTNLALNDLVRFGANVTNFKNDISGAIDQRSIIIGVGVILRHAAP
jgi:hypothetical protein